MKKISRIIVAIIIGASILTQTPMLTEDASAAPVQGWDAGYIVADQVFTNKTSMSVSSIQQFLNSKVPACDTAGAQQSEMNNSGVPDYNSNGSIQRWEWGKYRYNQTTFPCLRDYSQNGVSSAQLIYNAAQTYSINPQVLIVLLQKEQGLVTDTWPLSIQFRSATGYGCPDTAACDSQYYGLTNQVNWAARMFRAIMDDSPTWYTPYVVGSNYIRYNPNASCGGSNVNIRNRSTQALYNYTPYQPTQAALDAGWGTVNCGAYGNRNFYLYFQNWFGSPRGDYCLSGLTNVSTGVDFSKDQKGKPSTGKFMIYSGSSTKCVEFHTWNKGFGSWSKHSSSNSPNIDTANSSVQFADLNGDGKDEAVLVGLRATGSGKIEFHVWDDTLNDWRSHHASNATAIDPAVSQVSFADTDGDGKDEAVLVGLRGSGSGSGNIEFHIWNPGFSTWRSHHKSNQIGS